MKLLRKEYGDIHLIVSPDTLPSLIEACIALLDSDQEQVELDCMVDPSIFRTSTRPQGISFETSDEDALVLENSRVVLRLCKETIDYLAFLLGEASRGRRIAPEITEISVKGFKMRPYLVLDVG